MSQKNIKNIRLRLIKSDDKEALSDEVVKLYLDTAETMANTTDDLALQFYACYLMANEWETLGRITRTGNTSLEYPDPSYFERMYNKRIAMLNSSNNVGFGSFRKVSMEKEYKYEDVDGYGSTLEPR